VYARRYTIHESVVQSGALTIVGTPAFYELPEWLRTQPRSD
jgi:hypothetical protein